MSSSLLSMTEEWDNQINYAMCSYEWIYRQIWFARNIPAFQHTMAKINKSDFTGRSVWKIYNLGFFWEKERWFILVVVVVVVFLLLYRSTNKSGGYSLATVTYYKRANEMNRKIVFLALGMKQCPWIMCYNQFLSLHYR